MSKLQQPVPYSENGLRNQIINCYISIHDLNCGCNEPLKHIIQQILEKEPTLKECLGTTTGETTGNVEDILQDGDLERFFAENFGEEEDAADG